MERRKIQLIAGSTYSVSLPKEWVKRNSLKEKNEIILYENNDKTLTISPELIKETKLNEISLDAEEYKDNIDQILFAVYYLGAETINIISKKELDKSMKSQIRKTLTHMSGTEIAYEDKNKITIKVLLDKSKINIKQLVYRISLIIDLSIQTLITKLDIHEIRINENEIDRLFHLASKIVSLSLINTSILKSSEIRNSSLVPSYFLICKKLENIGDNIKHFSEHLYKNKIKITDKKEILDFIRLEINRSIRYLLKDTLDIFKKIPENTIKKVKKEIAEIGNDVMFDYLEDTVRYLIDVQEEVVRISFYNQLFQKENL